MVKAADPRQTDGLGGAVRLDLRGSVLQANRQYSMYSRRRRLRWSSLSNNVVEKLLGSALADGVVWIATLGAKEPSTPIWEGSVA